VKLTSIDLPGFGCLTRFHRDLAPGLNVFFGDNEAGKSTLQQAICAMLYGFYDGDGVSRAAKEDKARHERYRPWGGDAYRGMLAYELEDGSRFEVRRDFSTPDVLTQVLDGEMGTDVSGRFGSGRHGNVPFARKHLGMSRSVFQSCAFISQGEVFEVEKNAPTQIGDAIAALADSGRRDVSAARAMERLDTALGRVGSDRARTAELPVAREKLKRAQAELRTIDHTRKETAEKAQRLDALRKRLRAAQEEATRSEYLLRKAEAKRLRSQLLEADRAEAAITAAGDLSEETGPTISGELRDEVLGLTNQLAMARTLVERLEEESAQALSAVSDEERLEYGLLCESAGSLTDAQVTQLKSQAYLAATTTESGIWAAVKAVGRAVMRALARIARAIVRRQAAPGTPEEPAISRPEALALLEKHSRYLELRPRIERIARAERHLEGERGSVAQLEMTLEAVLRSVDIAVGEGVATLEARWAEQREREERRQAAVEAERRRTVALAGRSRDEIGEEMGGHEAALAEMEDERPALAGCEPHQAPEQIRRTLGKLRDEEKAAAVESATLSEELRQALGGHRSRAEVEEEIACYESDVGRLERARAALEMARGAIQEAMTSVYRDFAPAVNTFLSEGLEAATDGRYRRAHVDPATLKVSLLVPETDQVVTDPPVSHGTRTLIYVLMRIGLAQHMSAIGEPVPLVLDDPFVDVDSVRLPRMLDFLLELSERMQVMIFTKDAEIASWFERRAAGPRHELHRMFTVLAPAL